MVPSVTGSVATLECDALSHDIAVLDVAGTEGMNALPHWSVTFLCSDPDLDFDSAVGATATLRLSDAQEGSARPVPLLITDLAYDGEERDGHRYVASLSAPEWVVTLRSGYRVFTDKSTQEIVSAVLGDAGVPQDRVVWRLAGTYVRRVQCVQYGETDWAFLERLLADEGISYWFDWVDGVGPALMLADSAEGYDGILAPDVLPFEDASGMVAARHFSELELGEQLATEAVHIREYDVRHPDVFLEGLAGEGALEHFEYPACVLTKDAATARAKARLEQLRRFSVWANGTSDCVRLQPGRVVRVEGLADGVLNQRYLVVEAEHDVAQASPHRTTARAYRNRVRMVPAGRMAFRPAMAQRAPRIEGLTTAVTTGPSGEEIHVDDLGRVKLRFLWDRSGITDDRSSAWARCVQMGMGGAMLLPRVGWEVPIGYLDGNPDRPIVLGRVYNATAIVPYALPGASATTTLQSATSPGGGSTNEVRLADGAGGQELFIHASRDQSVSVGGSATTKVGANETHDVGLSYGLSVAGSQTHTVGGSQSVDVATDYATGVKGGRTESVGGSEIIDVTANRFVGTGAYTELVSAAYTLRCNQSNTSVSGGFLQTIGAGLGLAAGLGTSESVAAVRTETVGGMRSIIAGKFSENVTGIKSVTAGTANENAGAKVVISATAAGTIKVGGSANVTAGGDVILDAPTITIDVGGSLNANALSLAGGALKATKGTTKMKGNIKRTGGSKVG